MPWIAFFFGFAASSETYQPDTSMSTDAEFRSSIQSSSASPCSVVRPPLSGDGFDAITSLISSIEASATAVGTDAAGNVVSEATASAADAGAPVSTHPSAAANVTTAVAPASTRQTPPSGSTATPFVVTDATATFVGIAGIDNAARPSPVAPESAETSSPRPDIPTPESVVPADTTGSHVSPPAESSVPSTE